MSYEVSRRTLLTGAAGAVTLGGLAACGSDSGTLGGSDIAGRPASRTHPSRWTPQRGHGPVDATADAARPRWPHRVDLGVRRHRARPADPSHRRRPAPGPRRQPAPGRDQRALARHRDPQRHGRRPRRHPGRDRHGRHLPLRLHRARPRHLLLPPARRASSSIEGSTASSSSTTRPSPGDYDHEWIVVLDDWVDGTGRTPDAVLAHLTAASGTSDGMSGMGGMNMGGMDMGGMRSSILGQRWRRHLPLLPDQRPQSPQTRRPSMPGPANGSGSGSSTQAPTPPSGSHSAAIR